MGGLEPLAADGCLRAFGRQLWKLPRSLGDEQPTQNWYRQGKSDCLIKKNCDRLVLKDIDTHTHCEHSKEIQTCKGKPPPFFQSIHCMLQRPGDRFQIRGDFSGLGVWQLVVRSGICGV